MAIPARQVGTGASIQRLKKPKISSHDHSFSPIKNPEIVLEISAVTEYFGKLFNPLLRKIKKRVFHTVK